MRNFTRQWKHIMRVKFRSVLLPVSLAALVLATGFQPDSEVEKLLASMRTAYQSAETATVKVKSRVKVGEDWISGTSTLHYEKPNRLNLAFKLKDVLTHRVSDGRKVFTWIELDKVKSEGVDPDSLGNDAPINLECLSFFDWKRQLSTSPGANMEKSKFKLIKSENWNGRNWIVLEESAHGQSVFVRYFIDPNTYMIWRCDVRDLERRSPFLETEVTELTLNPKLGAGLFKAPTKGS